MALERVTVAADTPDAKPFVQDDGATESGPAGGLTPAQLASAYEYDPAEGGAGQTIALIDAYDDPNIEKDLSTFDGHYGLAPCTTANGCFAKVGQTGSGSSPVTVSAKISGLEPNSEYHFRVVTANAAGTSKGEDLTFKTP